MKNSLEDTAKRVSGELEGLNEQFDTLTKIFTAAAEDAKEAKKAFKKKCGDLNYAREKFLTDKSVGRPLNAGDLRTYAILDDLYEEFLRKKHIRNVAKEDVDDCMKKIGTARGYLLAINKNYVKAGGKIKR